MLNRSATGLSLTMRLQVLTDIDPPFYNFLHDILRRAVFLGIPLLTTLRAQPLFTGLTHSSGPSTTDFYV